MERYRKIDNANYYEECGDIFIPEYINSIVLECIENLLVKIENNETEELVKELGMDESNWILEDYWAGAHDILKGIKEWINSHE